MNKANKILHNFFSNDVVLIMKEKQKNPTLSNKDAIDILKTLSIDELVEKHCYYDDEIVSIKEVSDEKLD